MRDFSKRIQLRNSDQWLEKKDRTWAFYEPNRSQYPSLAEAVAGAPNFLGFYQFRYQIDNAGLTINDLFDENPTATVTVLNAQFAQIQSTFQETSRKFRQYRDAIEAIRSAPGDAIYPQLKKLLEGYIEAWDDFDCEVH